MIGLTRIPQLHIKIGALNTGHERASALKLECLAYELGFALTLTLC